MGRTAAPDPWFALTADTEDELHDIAECLGLTRVMFQPATPLGPRQVPVAGHYQVTMGERDLALTLGAQAIKPKDADIMARQRAGMPVTSSRSIIGRYLKSFLRGLSGGVRDSPGTTSGT